MPVDEFYRGLRIEPLDEDGFLATSPDLPGVKSPAPSLWEQDCGMDRMGSKLALFPRALRILNPVNPVHPVTP